MDATTTPDRRRSRLALAADATARAMLLATLERCDWNLTATAEALELTGASNVLHSIKRLGLGDEYNEAKRAGKISPGNRIQR